MFAVVNIVVGNVFVVVAVVVVAVAVVNVVVVVVVDVDVVVNVVGGVVRSQGGFRSLNDWENTKIT